MTNILEVVRIMVMLLERWCCSFCWVVVVVTNFDDVFLWWWGGRSLLFFLLLKSLPNTLFFYYHLHLFSRCRCCILSPTFLMSSHLPFYFFVVIRKLSLRGRFPSTDEGGFWLAHGREVSARGYERMMLYIVQCLCRTPSSVPWCLSGVVDWMPFWCPQPVSPCSVFGVVDWRPYRHPKPFSIIIFRHSSSSTLSGMMTDGYLLCWWWWAGTTIYCAVICSLTRGCLQLSFVLPIIVVARFLTVLLHFQRNRLVRALSAPPVG